MKCETHPKYKGISKPRVACYDCWMIFQNINPEHLPFFIPKSRWWHCDCHGELQKNFYPALAGGYKLCLTGSARLIWGDKLEDIIKNKLKPNKTVKVTEYDLLSEGCDTDKIK